MNGLPPDIALVPLVGHMHGHAGVAIKSQGLWLLQTGDAYFFREEMNLDKPWCAAG